MVGHTDKDTLEMQTLDSTTEIHVEYQQEFYL